MVEALPTKGKKQKNLTDKVRVGVRVRPPLPREIESGKFTNCVATENKNQLVYVSLKDEPVILTQGGEVPEGV